MRLREREVQYKEILLFVPGSVVAPHAGQREASGEVKARPPKKLLFFFFFLSGLFLPPPSVAR